MTIFCFPVVLVRTIKNRIQIIPVAVLLSTHFCILPVSGAEREPLPVPPPMAKSQSVSAFLGNSTEITLTLGGRIVEPVTILIRKPPLKGKLTEIIRTGRNTAAVVYTPDSSTVAGTDTFSFAVKSVDSPVSAAATIGIALLEKPPRMEFPQELDFGPVFLGDTIEKEITIRNTGGGVASWQLTSPPPWSIVNPAKYRIPGGTRVDRTIAFAPAEEREYRGRIQMSSDPKDSLAVRGSGIAPVSWDGAGITVSPEGRSAGKAYIKLTNRTPSERAVSFEWPEVVKSARKVVLPPDSTAIQEIEVIGSSQLNFDGEVVVRSGNFQTTLPLRIFPAAAKIEVDPERVLKLSSPQKDHFTLKNRGGSDAALEIVVPPGIHLEPDPRGVTLSPGQEQRFDVRLDSNNREAWPVKIQSPGCPAVELVIEGPATKQNRPSVAMETPHNIHPGKPGEPKTVPPSGPGPIRRGEWPVITSAGTREIIVTSKVPAEASSFRVERRRISPGPNNEVQETWIPWQGAVYKLDDRTADARLVRLPQNRKWTIRFLPLDAGGNPLPPSQPVQVATLPEHNLPVSWWLWLGLATALTLVASSIWRKYQARLLAGENERIARLEQK